jgi:hypothetical protein
MSKGRYNMSESPSNMQQYFKILGMTLILTDYQSRVQVEVSPCGDWK